MKYNSFIRLLCSIPIILVFLYFIPFVGVCLILLRYFLYSEKKKILVPIILMLVGSLILIPGCLLELAKMTNFNIPSKITSIFTDSFYSVNLINYSKNLFIVGIIFLFLISIFRGIFDRAQAYLKSYIQKEEKVNREISSKNDLIMKEKIEAAKNMTVVYCPHCGADNILTTNVGTCKYCRSKLEVKNKN